MRRRRALMVPVRSAAGAPASRDAAGEFDEAKEETPLAGRRASDASASGVEGSIAGAGST